LQKIGAYRRILKYILENACEINMVSTDEDYRHMLDRLDPMLNELFYLGKFLIQFVSQFSEQAMYKDVMNIEFDKNNLFVLSRNCMSSNKIELFHSKFKRGFC